MSKSENSMFGAFSNYLKPGDKKSKGKIKPVVEVIDEEKEDKKEKPDAKPEEKLFNAKRGRPKGSDDPRAGKDWKNTSIGVNSEQWRRVEQFAHDTDQPTIKHALCILLQCALEQYEKNKEKFVLKYIKK